MSFDDYMFAKPSFLNGVARILDIGGTFDDSSYWISNSPEEADARALARDWAAVGCDLAEAMEWHGEKK